MILQALLLAAQAPAAAAMPTDPTAFDLRCVAAMSELTEHEESSVQQAGQIGMFYFLGRLDGRHPGRDLTPLLESEAEAITGQDLGPYLKACGDLMEVRGQELVAGAQRIEGKPQAR